MSEKKVSRDNKQGCNYIVCLDHLVLVCIIVIAGRPDGLAITVSAVIVAMLALLYRCTVNIKTYVSGSARRKTITVHARQPVAKAAPEVPAETTSPKRSWLRDGD